MRRSTSSVKAGAQRFTRFRHLPSSFPGVLNNASRLDQLLDAEIYPSKQTADHSCVSEDCRIEGILSTTTETLPGQVAGTLMSASGYVRLKPYIQYSATQQRLFSAFSNIHGSSGCIGNTKLENVNSLLVNTWLEHSDLTHCIVRKLKRSHMSQSHHHRNHDASEATGDAGERVSRLGLAADMSLAAGKGFAGYLSGSTAIIADAAHSMSDVVLSGVALYVLKAARAPKDEKHPYGHGKFETIGALGISSMLLVTGGGIAWHAFEVLQALLSATDGASLSSVVQHGADHIHSSEHGLSHGVHHHGIDKEHQNLALSAALISICAKEGLYWVTKRVGDARGSELLKANAWHHRTDAISSVIALLGIGGAILGWPFLDPFAGIVVSGMVVRAGLQTGYQSLQELVDSAVPESVLSPFKDTVMKVKGVEGCHDPRGRRAGSSIHLDIHIEVDPWLSVSAAHTIGETARERLRKDHPFLEDIFISIEPSDALLASSSPKNNVSSDFMARAKHNGEARTDHPQQQEVEKAVRTLIETDFSQVMTFERVRCHFLQGRVLVELEVSMSPNISIRDAMHHAQNAEGEIIKAFPKISAVDTQLRLSSYL